MTRAFVCKADCVLALRDIRKRLFAAVEISWYIHLLFNSVFSVFPLPSLAACRNGGLHRCSLGVIDLPRALVRDETTGRSGHAAFIPTGNITAAASQCSGVVFVLQINCVLEKWYGHLL